jgi:hypothetical protein
VGGTYENDLFEVIDVHLGNGATPSLRGETELAQIQVLDAI